MSLSTAASLASGVRTRTVTTKSVALFALSWNSAELNTPEDTLVVSIPRKSNAQSSTFPPAEAVAVIVHLKLAVNGVVEVE